MLTVALLFSKVRLALDIYRITMGNGYCKWCVRRNGLPVGAKASSSYLLRYCRVIHKVHYSDVSEYVFT